MIQFNIRSFKWHTCKQEIDDVSIIERNKYVSQEKEHIPMKNITMLNSNRQKQGRYILCTFNLILLK